jgi:hypothetical protein
MIGQAVGEADLAEKANLHHAKAVPAFWDSSVAVTTALVYLARGSRSTAFMPYCYKVGIR